MYEERHEHPEELTVYNESTAYRLQSFYMGIERLFTKINMEIDKKTFSYSKDDDKWHKEMLKSMSLDIKGVRPKVISNETFKMLGEYLGFRHWVRYYYYYQLDIKKLLPLIKDLEETYSYLKKDLKLFSTFLKQTAK